MPGFDQAQKKEIVKCPAQNARATWTGEVCARRAGAAGEGDADRQEGPRVRGVPGGKWGAEAAAWGGRKRRYRASDRPKSKRQGDAERNDRERNSTGLLGVGGRVQPRMERTLGAITSKV